MWQPNDADMQWAERLLSTVAHMGKWIWTNADATFVVDHQRHIVEQIGGARIPDEDQTRCRLVFSKVGYAIQFTRPKGT